ncbi:DUF6364 family protein [Flavobacteriaceae bacterium]|nr:DUF6364 family protein [Flavobacteriaceae bacterium]MDC1265262.1 DUF6364 family protein [Flavobacteriaceae bacterium]
MDTKLTLNVDKTIIEKAKVYAKSHKVSLSHLIESYLAALISESSKRIETTPLVDSLSGVIDLEPNFDFKEDYTNFLIEKYK